MVSKKIVCLGGGSLYFRRALSDLLIREDLSGSEIVLYDIDADKVEIMAAMGRRLAERAGTGFGVRSTVDMADAVDGADFALSSIGGSGAEVTSNVYGSYYHNADMHIPSQYGIHQIVGDTGGPAGMMMAFRSIPAYMAICREMEKRCPKVILLNHSNPMAVLCRAMTKYTDLTVIGICHGVQGGIRHAADLLGVSPQELECVWIGTNHYYWFTRVLHKGEDVYPGLMRRLAERPPEEGRIMSARLSQVYGYKIVYPEDDHIIEFYPFATQAASQSDLPYSLAEKAKAHGHDAASPLEAKAPASEPVRAEFLRNYREIIDATALPEKPSDPITGEGIAGMISAMAHGRREVYIVNIPNQGLIPNLPEYAVLEAEGVTDSRGVRGIQAGECPLHLEGILRKRIVWQELVADAAVRGDRGLALQALLVDEMAIVPEQAEAMLDELLAASKDLLPQFDG